MTRILVVEGKYDAIVLRTLLSATELSDVQIIEGGGKSAAISLGTSLALNKLTRVAIVVDADTTDPRRIREQHSIFDDLQYHGSSRGSCELFLAVPTLEGELFPNAEDFASTFSLDLTPKQLDRYHEDWKFVLRAFLSESKAGKLTTIRTRGICQSELEKLFKKPLLRDLKAYLDN